MFANPELKRKIAEQERELAALRSRNEALQRKVVELLAGVRGEAPAGDVAEVGSYGGTCAYCACTWNGPILERSINRGTDWLRYRYVECPECHERRPV